MMSAKANLLKAIYSVLAVLISSALLIPVDPTALQKTKLNQLQLIGSHNSYKIWDCVA